MPVLFGYIVTLSVLMGGGYAGLLWLSGPDSTYQRPAVDEKSAPRRKNISEESPRIAETVAVPNEVDGTSIAETNPVPTFREGSDKVGQEAKEMDPKPNSENPKSEKVDGVPAGGCMPIGLTAKGELVFPMQCLELIERRRGPGPSSPPVQAVPASGENQAIELAKPNESIDAVQAAPSNKDGPDERWKGIAPKSEITHSNANSESDVARKESNESRNVIGTEQSDYNGAGKRELTTGDIKPSNPNLAVEATPRKLGKQKRSSRSKPVMMILRTVQYPDGSRRERLLSMSRSRKTVRTKHEWYNALGLR